MISYSEIEKGLEIIYQKKPCKVLEANFMFKGRGQSNLQVKLKNLIDGSIISTTFRPSDNFEEADISKKEIKFIYSHKEDYVFCYKNDPSNRFTLKKEQLKEKVQFLKPENLVEALFFKEELINISLPIKMQFKVEQAPPGIKGNRSEAGTKQVILEGGAKIDVPLFIKQGDIIEVNTESQEYVKRIQKN